MKFFLCKLKNYLVGKDLKNGDWNRVNVSLTLKKIHQPDNWSCRDEKKIVEKKMCSRYWKKRLKWWIIKYSIVKRSALYKKQLLFTARNDVPASDDFVLTMKTAKLSWFSHLDLNFESTFFLSTSIFSSLKHFQLLWCFF